MTHSYLCISVDGLFQLEIDGALENVPLELKTFYSYDSWNDALSTAADVDKFQRCVFGDSLLKIAVGNVGCSDQLLYRTLVMRADKVFHVVSGQNEVAHVTLASVPKDAIKRYFGILYKFAIIYLRWKFEGSTDPFSKDKLSDYGLALWKHDVNIHAAQLHFSIWKELHIMIQMKKRPMPRCLKILPHLLSTGIKERCMLMCSPSCYHTSKFQLGKLI